MSKIDFLKTIYTKFIDENSVIFSIGLISNDEKTVLSQITNNLTHVKNLESDSNSYKFSLVKIDTTENFKVLKNLQKSIEENKADILLKTSNEKNCFDIIESIGYHIYDVSPADNISDCAGPLSKEEFNYYSDNVSKEGNFLCVHKDNVKKYNLPTIVPGKICGIIFGRNDGYKEKERFIIHITKMLETFDEVIYVDWNSDKNSFLCEIINDIPKSGKLKHIVIEPKIANILNEYNPKLISGCNGSLANNLAIRRTDAEYIVVTASDIIPPSREILVNFIKTTNKNSFYTLSRRDIEYDDIIKNKDNLKEYIEYLNKTSSPRYFPAKVTPNDNYSIFNCPGDFQFAHKNIWLKIKGYEEKMIYACFGDTNIQKKSVLYGFNLVPIYDVPLYHMSHKGMGNDGASPSKKFYNDPMEWVEYFYKYTIHNYTFISKNSDTWGFSDVEIECEII
jgi:hypothetical protein